jgi:hypothetical protein
VITPSDLIEPRHQPLRRHADVGGNSGSELPDKLGRPPARLVLGQRLQPAVGHEFAGGGVEGPLGDGAGDRSGDDPLPRLAYRHRPRRPLGLQRGVDAVGLGRSAVGDGLALQAPPLSGCGVALEALHEPLQLLGDALLDRPGARRELGEDLGRDRREFGDAVGRLVPRHAEGAGQLRPEPGVVER